MNLRYIKQTSNIRPNNIEIELNHYTKYKLYELDNYKIIDIIEEFDKRINIPMQPKIYVKSLKIIIPLLKQELLWRKYNDRYK